MNFKNLPYLRYCFITVIMTAISPLSLSAQVIPDNTLNAESSTIRSIDDLQSAIEGGAIRGKNLFHSFQEFNVAQEKKFSFTNPNGISLFCHFPKFELQ